MTDPDQRTAHFTSRGFRVYADMKDSYGAAVRVVESSTAITSTSRRGPFVWIFAEGGSVDNNDGAAHLELQEAIRVRDALNTFIVENT